MICKLGHESEISSLPFAVTGKLYDNIFELLIVLDSKYGAWNWIGRAGSLPSMRP